MTGVQMIKKEGFEIAKIKGSHYHMKRDGRYVIVPHHHQELGKGLCNRILTDAGLA